MRITILFSVCLLVLFGCKSENSQKHDDHHQAETPINANDNKAKSIPDWAKSATIYEVNTRQYTPEGTFAAFSEHIPRLKELGADILWFMPIHPISVKNRKGTLGSPYAVADYRDTNPEFGSVQDFDEMVNKIHAAGMKIIIDWVPNHTGWDNNWITEHPDWYTKDDKGNIIDPIDYNTGKSWGWTDVADLNYDNKDMRKAMIENLIYWVNERKVDGFRMDVAHGVPDDFWDECSTALFANSSIFMLSEGEVPTHRNNGNFHMDYGWSFHHLLNEIAKGEKNVTDIYAWKADYGSKYEKGVQMNFTSNHDENTWAGTEMDRMGEGHKAFAVLTQTFEGMPLIYSGQEAANTKRLEFFEKEHIDFSSFPYADFYKQLNELKDRNKGLWNAEFGGNVSFVGESENIIAYQRAKGGDKVVVLINLSDKPSEVSIIAHIDKVKDIFTGRSLHHHDGDKISLGPWEYIVASSN